MTHSISPSPSPTSTTSTSHTNTIFPPEMFFIAITCFLLYRLTAIQSIGQILLGRLIFLMPPSAQQLEQLVPVWSAEANKRTRRKILKSKTSELELTTRAIDASIFQGQSVYERMDTLVFLALVSIMGFLFSDVYSCYWNIHIPHHTEHVTWIIIITCGYAVYGLTIFVTESGYWSYSLRMSLIAGAIMLIISSIFIFSMPKSWIDIHVHESYTELVTQASRRSDAIRFPTSSFLYSLLLILVSTCQAIWFLFPAMRFTRSYLFIVMDADTTPTSFFSWAQLIRIVHHINFCTPFIIVAMWMSPVQYAALSTGVSLSFYHSFRLWFLLFACILRLSLFRLYAQAHLSSAIINIKRMTRAINQQSGKEIQLMLRQTLIFLPTMALQYLAPAVLALLTAFMMKRKTGVCLGLCALAFTHPTSISTPTSTITTPSIPISTPVRATTIPVHPSTVTPNDVDFPFDMDLDLDDVDIDPAHLASWKARVQQQAQVEKSRHQQATDGEAEVDGDRDGEENGKESADGSNQESRSASRALFSLPIVGTTLEWFTWSAAFVWAAETAVSLVYFRSNETPVS